MRPLSRRSFALLSLAAALPLAAEAAFPDKQVRLVVPYSAGGGTDTIARHLAERLRPRLGQNVIVENKPGADGIIGTDLVAKAPADGHTFVLVVTSHLVNPAVKKKLPYDTLKDFVGVTKVAVSPMVFLVNSDFPANNPRELAALLKKDPSKATYGASENMTRLVGAMFNQRMQLNVTYAAYKGGAPLMTDIAGNNVGFGVGTLLTAKPLIQAGKIKAIGVTSGKRSPMLPNTPTMVESGLQDMEVYISYSLYAPAKTPREALERMQQEVRAVIHTPEMEEILAAQAATPVGNGVAEFNKEVLSEARLWERLVKDTGLEQE
ncbi:tripartite tricarboxylate transporter substrate binding protein [Ramlibacter monticola]|uniref:Tripartite tricarboxylate transporter substrate binding protein n=1 Tax=Ramlibacter monticola TaxID=1926872 RepID=A0A936Z1S0_9BURK|nr:tripartite tricarboxylate transporter substrate binding protein [Ramlibacter monticola]MBL0393339.1 tripartite tricarboxylate transporter substrate binding protein [Ramlibacter monticola]